MVRSSGIFIVIMLSFLVCIASCSYDDRRDLPESAGSDGRGDGTNTLKYQNRIVK
jgi:hypothetical protein